jgi:hypothetical protein
LGNSTWYNLCRYVPRVEDTFERSRSEAMS